MKKNKCYLFSFLIVFLVLTLVLIITGSTPFGNNSIVAYGSTVTGGDFPAHSMIGGYPAKIIKGGVNWRK